MDWLTTVEPHTLTQTELTPDLLSAKIVRRQGAPLRTAAATHRTDCTDMTMQSKALHHRNLTFLEALLRLTTSPRLLSQRETTESMFRSRNYALSRSLATNDRQTDRHTDRQTHRETSRQTDRQTMDVSFYRRRHQSSVGTPLTTSAHATHDDRFRLRFVVAIVFQLSADLIISSQHCSRAAFRRTAEVELNVLGRP